MDESQSTFDLQALGMIKVAGGDAESFLGGQLTSDIDEVKGGQQHLTAWCNPKGRVRFLARIFYWDTAYYLLLPRTQIATTLPRLTMFVLRADVQISDVSDEYVRYGLLDLNDTDLPRPDRGQAACRDNLIVLNVTGHTADTNARYLLISRLAIAEMAGTRDPADDEGVWRHLDIQAMLPSVQPQTTEMFIPQMLDLEALGGLSFQKGCYPGQEIIARLHYRGELKRQMYLATVSTDQLPEPGEPLFLADNTSATVGNVVDAQWQRADAQRASVLAVLQIEKADGDLRLNDANGPQLMLSQAD